MKISIVKAYVNLSEASTHIKIAQQETAEIEGIQHIREMIDSALISTQAADQELRAINQKLP